LRFAGGGRFIIIPDEIFDSTSHSPKQAWLLGTLPSSRFSSEERCFLVYRLEQPMRRRARNRSRSAAAAVLSISREGADGNFWFTLSNGTQVGRITPRGKITTFRTPTLSNPAFITLGPDGNVWFGEGSSGRIASITPAGQITEFQFSFFGVSAGITTGSDGNIWFSDQTDHASGAIIFRPESLPSSRPRRRIRSRAT
jgi:hypothetical protein